MKKLQFGKNKRKCNGNENDEDYGICGQEGHHEQGEVLIRKLYYWALGAQGMEFEKGIGIKVGGDTGLNYLIVQVHYSMGLPENTPDSFSRYVLTMTNQE